MTAPDPRPRTLHDDLDLLANAAPQFAAPPALRKPRRSTRRQAILLAAVATLLIPTGVTAAVVALRDNEAARGVDAAPASVLGTPAAVPESEAYNYSAGCDAAEESQGYCPIDPQGQRTWDELVAAFDGYLTPITLVMIPQSERGPEAPGNTDMYTFEAWIGSPDEPESRFRLRADVTVPQSEDTKPPSIETHPAFPEDFRFGQGLVTITQSDGTVIYLRFWGPVATMGSLDVPVLFREAADRLAE